MINENQCQTRNCPPPPPPILKHHDNHFSLGNSSWQTWLTWSLKTPQTCLSTPSLLAFDMDYISLAAIGHSQCAHVTACANKEKNLAKQKYIYIIVNLPCCFAAMSIINHSFSNNEHCRPFCFIFTVSRPVFNHRPIDRDGCTLAFVCPRLIITARPCLHKR